MKKNILSALAIVAIAANTQAQVITDTVSTGAGYANQVWYNLEDGNETSAPRAEWDLAFAVPGFSTSIHANTASGVKVWAYPGTNAEWSAVDTNGLSTWPLLYNSETSWELGALDQNMDPNEPFDVGWGIYNVNTHIITGDSLYIIQLSNGDYKKLDIVNLASGAFNFRYSNLNNSNEVVTSLTKADYAGQNFGYYSITNEETIDREPLSADWDMLFTQYTSFVPTAYPVGGILTNKGWEVAEASGIADPSTYTDASLHTFSEDINIIGSDWKAFDMGTFAYVIEDDRVYFMQNEDGDIWKVIPTGFGGTANGNYIFTKEKIATASHLEQSETTILSVYPNPNNTGTANLVFSHQNETSEFTMLDSEGRIVKSDVISGKGTLVNYSFDVSDLKGGVYFIQLKSNGASITSKLIIQ